MKQKKMKSNFLDPGSQHSFAIQIKMQKSSHVLPWISKE
jgi:hypothetical protein